MALSPDLPGVPEPFSQRRICDQPLERGRQLRGPMRRDQEARHSIYDRLTNPADSMPDNRQTAPGRFKINKPEPLNTLLLVDARHGENIRLVVDRAQLRIGDVA